MSNLRLLLPPNVSPPSRRISLCPSSEPACFSITQITSFQSYFASRCATSSCSCVQLPGSCNLRPRRTARFGTRHSANVTMVFCSPRLPPPPPPSPVASAPLSPRYCFPRVFRTFALFACMVIWNAPRVPERCGPPFVAIFLFTLGSWTIPCVMLFEVFVFAHSRVVIFYL